VFDVKTKVAELAIEGQSLAAEHNRLAMVNTENAQKMANIKARVDFINGALEAYNSLSDGQTEKAESTN
jgi:hypothetical protein